MFYYGLLNIWYPASYLYGFLAKYPVSGGYLKFSIRTFTKAGYPDATPEPHDRMYYIALHKVYT